MKNLLNKLPIIFVGALLASFSAQAMKRMQDSEQDEQPIKKRKTDERPRRFPLPTKFAAEEKIKFTWRDADENEWIEVLVKDAKSIKIFNNMLDGSEISTSIFPTINLPLETLKKFFNCLHIISAPEEVLGVGVDTKETRLINYLDRAVSTQELRDMLQEAHNIGAASLEKIFSEKWFKLIISDEKIVKEQAPLSLDCSRFILKQNLKHPLYKKIEEWSHKLYAPRKLPSDGTSSVCMCMSPNSDFFVAGSSENTAPLCIWNNKNTGEKPIQSLEGHRRKVSALAFSPDSQTLASGDSGGEIRLWIFLDGKWHLKATLSEHDMRIHSLAFSPPTSSRELFTLASGAADRTIKLWEAGEGSLLASLENNDPPHGESAILSLGFNPQGKTLIFQNENAIRVLNLETMDSQPICNNQFHESFKTSISPDGLNITAYTEGGITVWSNIDGFWIEKFLVSLVNCYRAFFETNTRIVSLSSQNMGDDIIQKIMLWNYNNGTWFCEATVNLSDREFMSVYVSPDCQVLASKEDKKEIALWNLPTIWMISELLAGMTVEQMMLLKLIIAAENNNDILNLSGQLVAVFNTLPQSFRTYLMENSLIILPSSYEG